MVKRRREVARALLANKDSTEVDDVLNFFDLIGYLVERKAIDAESMWIHFSDAAFGYWFATIQYIAHHREVNPHYFDHFQKLIAELLPIEAKKRGITVEEIESLEKHRVRDFLKDESRLQRARWSRRQEAVIGVSPRR